MANNRASIASRDKNGSAENGRLDSNYLRFAP